MGGICYYFIRIIHAAKIVKYFQKWTKKLLEKTLKEGAVSKVIYPQITQIYTDC